MSGSEIELSPEKLEKAVFERLIKGESEDDLRAQLQTRLDAQSAERILTTASDRIETLKREGRYDDEEFRILTKPRRARRPAWDVLACMLIVIGLARACVVVPGATPEIAWFLPVLLGSVILVANRR